VPLVPTVLPARMLFWMVVVPPAPKKPPPTPKPVLSASALFNGMVL
jgi:hypothetical protein